MSFNDSLSDNDLDNTNSIAKYQGTFGAWFIICFFGIIVGIIVYPWYHLWREKKDEEDPDAMGSFYDVATIKYTFALRRNALREENKISAVIDV